jgi:hypothetical protein
MRGEVPLDGARAGNADEASHRIEAAPQGNTATPFEMPGAMPGRSARCNSPGAGAFRVLAGRLGAARTFRLRTVAGNPERRRAASAGASGHRHIR